MVDNDPVLTVMRQKLEMYEAAGMADHAKNVKARIAKREKDGVPKAAPVVSLTDVKTVSTTVTAPTKPTVKKAAKKSAKK